MVLFGVLAGAADARAFFTDPGTACAVHAVRPVVSLGTDASGQDVVAQNVTYRDLCNPDLPGYRARGLFDPHTQYPSLPRCTGPNADSAWPVCVPNPVWSGCDPLDPRCLKEPDMGYRYPLVLPAGAVAPRIFQDPAQDWWPICVDVTATLVVSDPLARSCPATTEEVGRCQASAHYHEKLNGPGSNTQMPAARFYSFVTTKEVRDPATSRFLTTVIHPDCETDGPSCANCSDRDGCQDPCGHDVLSAITTCKLLCTRYFGRLTYQPGSGGGWSAVAAGGLSTTPISYLGYCNQPPSTAPVTCPMTPLDICLNDCGPPFAWVENGQYVEDAPPWVTHWSNRQAYEKDNHWYFVTFGRNWNPNDNLDNWLRSYSSNKDKPTAPANVCQGAVAKYCAKVAVGTTQAAVCKAARLPAGWQFPRPSGDLDGDGDPTDDSFCAHLYRTNYLCPQTCIACGTDCDPNPRHNCADRSGVLGGAACRPLEYLGTAATCCDAPPCYAVAPGDVDPMCR